MPRKLLFALCLSAVSLPTAALAEDTAIDTLLSNQDTTSANIPSSDSGGIFETGVGRFTTVGRINNILSEDSPTYANFPIVFDGSGSNEVFTTGNGGFGGDVWGNISSDFPDYSSIFGDVNLSGNSDFGGGIIQNLNGSSGGGSFPGLTVPIGTPAPSPAPSAEAPARSEGFNPFRWIVQWSKKNIIAPVFRVLGRGDQKPRTPFGSGVLGTFNRNSIVQRRDQANLLSQEIARLMASPRLGEEGEEWVAAEAEETLGILEVGTATTNQAIELAVAAQELTSTQDVAKAVAEIGGHNAKISATILQMQGQSQASHIQLQQLMSASIELEANISEALDESNRRERLERASAFYRDAGETLYLRGVFSDGGEEKK